MKLKNLFMTAALAAIAALSGPAAFAQSAGDDDVALFRKDARSQKKQIIAANLELTDAEAEKFWPIYDRYVADLAAIWDKKFALITQYAESYGTLTDAQAEAYVKGRADVENSIMSLRLRY